MGVPRWRYAEIIGVENTSIVLKISSLNSELKYVSGIFSWTSYYLKQHSEDGRNAVDRTLDKLSFELAAESLMYFTFNRYQPPRN